jgi:pimeloyl-ACP methyl ester carboxylesterase
VTVIDRRTWLMLPWAGAAGLAGCAWWPRKAVVPMPVIRLAAPVASQRKPVLVVMLPGAYSVPKDFIDQGFVGALRTGGFAVDVALADAHLGYVENGTLLERLRDDVLMPARHEGYQRIWLVGISLGGFASLGLLMQQPDALDGVLAIAPYAGRPELLQQVAAAGGAEPFALVHPSSDDLEAELWRWLGRSDAALRRKLYVYTGSDDRLIAGQRLLEALLDADHVLELPGTHDWPVWKALWSHWLARAPWPRG